MLMRLQGQKRYAEAELKVRKASPKFRELEGEYKRARTDESRERIAEEMQKIVIRVQKITPEQLKTAEEAEKKYKEEQSKFAEDFDRHPFLHQQKVLDIFYVDDKTVTFASTGPMGSRFLSHEEKERILGLILAGNCRIYGFKKVHFKAPQCSLNITDPSIEGIFHVVNGSADVNYEAVPYMNVIRARGEVNALGGFKRKGDLYVPERFATQNWWRKKPALDIAVHKGRITLNLRSQKPMPKEPSYGYLTGLYENILKENITKDKGLEQYINESYDKKYN